MSLERELYRTAGNIDRFSVVDSDLAESGMCRSGRIRIWIIHSGTENPAPYLNRALDPDPRPEPTFLT
jgi:hypothetical protein